MRPTSLSWASQTTTIVNLSGGVDENLSSLQQTPGTLIDVANYMIAEGETGGYQSVKGYERYDGTQISSEVDITTISLNDPTMDLVLGETIEGATGTAVTLGPSVTDGTILTVEVELTSDTFDRGEELTVDGSVIGTFRNTKASTPTEDFHSLYDVNRTNIKPVGDTDCEGKVLGIVLFKDQVYAFRKKVDALEVGMYVASVSSWVEIDTSASPIVYGEHNFRFVEYNFYAGSATRSLYWVDGVNEARSFDGTTVASIPNAGMAGIDTPINISARSNRLYLAYTGGSLQYSALGDPTDWDGVNGAGEIGTGDEITNLVVGVGGALVIFNTSSILVIDGETPDSWTLNTFSPVSGAYAGTANRLLGTIFFLDDRGVTTMEAVEQYGDFAANSISAKFKKTLQANMDNLTSSIVSRELNQYRLFFENGLGITTSFKSKELQGTTFTQYPLTVGITAEGSLLNKRNVLLFGTSTEEYDSESTDGYVYLMDSGTSFDGHNIITKMTTSYYHCKSPRNWKRFISVMVEGNSTEDTLFNIKADYDYGTSDLPNNEWINNNTGESSENYLYGTAVYGTAVYGSGVVLSNTPVYLTGFGTNVSFKVITNLRFTKQHVLQNLLVDHTVLARRI